MTHSVQVIVKGRDRDKTSALILEFKKFLKDKFAVDTAIFGDNGMNVDYAVTRTEEEQERLSQGIRREKVALVKVDHKFRLAKMKSCKKKRKKLIQRIRKEKRYSIEEVLQHVPTWSQAKNKKIRVDFDGDSISMSSHRYQTFKEHGTTCVNCGLEGSFFLKEKYPNDKHFHFNLYAELPNGELVLMTKDHILPKSKGGKNHITNYQTMCTTCNGEKGDTIEGEESSN